MCYTLDTFVSSQISIHQLKDYIKGWCCALYVYNHIHLMAKMVFFILCISDTCIIYTTAVQLQCKERSNGKNRTLQTN